MPTLRSSGEAASEAAARTAAYGSSADAAASSASVTDAPIRTPPSASLDPVEAGVAEVDEERRRADAAVDLAGEVGAAAHRGRLRRSASSASASSRLAGRAYSLSGRSALASGRG